LIAATGSASWIPAVAAIAVAVTVFVIANRKASAEAAAAATPALAPARMPVPTPTADAQGRSALPLQGPTLGVIGIVIAGALWILANRFGLALGFLGVWYTALTILRARARSKHEVAEEGHALAAIHIASRALRAGIPVSGMIDILSKDARGQAGSAFREIKQREELGEEMTDSVQRVLVKSSQPALRAFGLVLLVQLTAGGNIAETADRLARSLVERGRIRRRARTILTYGRTAAIILAILPAVVVPILCVNLEGYAGFVFDRPAGNLLLAICTVLVAGGMSIVHRLTQIELARPRRSA
jgi:tight adherence protein B